MGFLKKLGQIIIKAAGFAAGFGQVIGAVVPGSGQVVGRITDTLSQLVGIIVNIEVAGQVIGTPGPDKLRMATPLVAAVILQSDALVGRKIKDAAKFQAGCAQLAGGIADILNSLDDDVKVENKAA